eukprot:CAMPEP_0205826152 /NCGR_PEP_ID=MMETSP0206-20130828/27774_1 /ASSEMBLY_ACC=CAM_ASM_000279 /TAXON_ID=36767 /ORGANISM="Euplotes focardii, Strain TN1" /LENGTH=395 /DNA_ID=CAMNT_0053125855 /DNA_START=335 /DNA_END=1522 /DNA_ORIENTATION=-
MNYESSGKKSKKSKKDIDVMGLSENKDRKAYNPIHADNKLLQKYTKGGLKKNSPDDSEDSEERPRRKSKKQNLNDSWERAMAEEGKEDPDKFSTYKKPTQTKPKEAALVDNSDNFGFDNMKGALQEDKHKFGDDSSGEDAAKDYQYNFAEEPKSFSSPVLSQNMSNPQHNRKEADYEFFKTEAIAGVSRENVQTEDTGLGDMFGGPSHRPSQPLPCTSSGIDDFFGGGNDNNSNNSSQQNGTAPSTGGLDDIFGGVGSSQSLPTQPPVQEAIFGGNTQPPQSQPIQNAITPPDPSSVFNTGQAFMQTYNTMGGGGYGAQNQYYNQNPNQNQNQNYGYQNNYNTGANNNGYNQAPFQNYNQAPPQNTYQMNTPGSNPNYPQSQPNTQGGGLDDLFN